MPDEHLKIVEAVLRTPGMIASLPAAEVAGKDIVKLSPAQWLNDEIINFYGVMVNLRSAAAKTRRDKGFAEPGDENLLDVHVFNSFFFSKFSEGGYNSVRRWTKKVGIQRMREYVALH
jgi:Ulp1 family protease